MPKFVEKYPLESRLFGVIRPLFYIYELEYLHKTDQGLSW